MVAPVACYDPTDHVPSCHDGDLHGEEDHRHPCHHDRVVRGLLGWYWEMVVADCEHSCVEGAVPVEERLSGRGHSRQDGPVELSLTNW